MLPFDLCQKDSIVDGVHFKRHGKCLSVGQWKGMCGKQGGKLFISKSWSFTEG